MDMNISMRPNALNIGEQTDRLTDQPNLHGDHVVNSDFAVVLCFDIVDNVKQVLDLDESSCAGRRSYLICPPAQSGLPARVSCTQRGVGTCKWLGDSTKLVNNTAGGLRWSREVSD